MLTTTPTTAPPAPVPSRRRRRRWWLWALAAVVILLGNVAIVGGMRLSRPLPEPVVTLTLPDRYPIPGTPPSLPWPAQGQAAVEVVGIGSLGSSGAAQPAPIASVAKIMTAYVILADFPLGTGDDGPTMTVTPAEAAAYQEQLAAGESLVKVAAGEVLTERQALTALLLPSADNVAWILARWDAGSNAAFLAKMNATAARLGMTATHYTDPSGLDKTTVSTAADQVKLAKEAMKVPVLAQLVALPQASVPVAGTVTNYNTLLGHDGIVGIKTGSTMAAGGCLVFAARFTVGGRELLLIGAILGQAGTQTRLLPLVLGASQKLVQAATAAVHAYVVVPAGQQVGTVRGPLGTGTTLVAGADLTVLGWPGMVLPVQAHATVPRTVPAGAPVGEIVVSGTTVSVVTTGALRSPGWRDRLLGHR
jgi:D-alanyl-D-alanine carboxypeptidase (penicillin-binding protein 5/6)